MISTCFSSITLREKDHVVFWLYHGTYHRSFCCHSLISCRSCGDIRTKIRTSTHTTRHVPKMRNTLLDKVVPAELRGMTIELRNTAATTVRYSPQTTKRRFQSNRHEAMPIPRMLGCSNRPPIHKNATSDVTAGIPTKPNLRNATTSSTRLATAIPIANKALREPSPARNAIRVNNAPRAIGTRPRAYTRRQFAICASASKVIRPYPNRALTSGFESPQRSIAAGPVVASNNRMLFAAVSWVPAASSSFQVLPISMNATVTKLIPKRECGIARSL